MIDVKRLKKLMRMKGLAPSSHAWGRIRHTVYRLVQGEIDPSEVAVRILTEIADALRVSPGSLLTAGPPDDSDREQFVWSDMEAVSTHLEAFGRAAQLIEIKPVLESYLMQDISGLTRWTFDQAHEAAAWSRGQIADSFRTMEDILAKDREVRDEEDYSHVMLMSEWFCREIGLHSYQWLVELQEVLRYWVKDRKIVLGIIPLDAWKSVYQDIGDVLCRWGLGRRWEKVGIADGVVALVRCSRSRYTIVTRRPVVDELLAALLRAAQNSRGFTLERTNHGVWKAYDATSFLIDQLAKYYRREKSPQGFLGAEERSVLWRRLALSTGPALERTTTTHGGVVRS